MAFSAFGRSTGPSDVLRHTGCEACRGAFVRLATILGNFFRPVIPEAREGYPGSRAGSFILRRLERTPSAMGPGSPLRFGRDDGAGRLR